MAGESLYGQSTPQGIFGGASTGTIPGNIPGQSAAPDVSDSITRLLNATPPEALVKAASTPTVTGHTMQLPTGMQRETGEFQPTPLNQKEVVGAGNARARGIGNSIVAATNALGKFVTAQAKIKHDHIRDAATNVIMHQKSIDDATQARDNAKASGDTQGVQDWQFKIDEATKARDAIFADLKLGKALQKGFNISYTDPSANKTEEHAAVQSAIKQAKTIQEKRDIIKQQQQKQQQARGQALGQAFAKSQPTQLGPNAQAQQRLAAWNEERKLQLDSVKALIPYFTELKRSGTEITKELIQERSASAVAAIQGQKALDVQILKNQQDNINNAASIELEKLKGYEARLTASAIAGEPNTIKEDFLKASDSYLKHLEENQKERTELNKQLDSESRQSRRLEIRAQLKRIDDQDDVAKNSFQFARDFAAKQAGVTIEQMPIPTVHVGDNVDGSGKSGSKSKPASDNNPFTGKPYPKGTSNVERLLNSVIHGAGQIFKESTTDQDPDNEGVKRFFPNVGPKED